VGGWELAWLLLIDLVASVDVALLLQVGKLRVTD
jgi:hypothetical protein